MLMKILRPERLTGQAGVVTLFAGWVLYRLLLRKPNLQVRGSLIVITGASQGVGRETCKHLTAQGADVVMVARSWGLLEATRLEIEGRGWGGHAYAEACDCSDEDAVELMAERVVRNHGVPDVVVNCAGQGSWKFLHEMTCEEVRGCLNVPTLATAFVSKSFLPHMRARGTGSLVIVQSPISRAALPGATAYSTARYALRGLYLGLCQDMAGTDITVQEVILPGVLSDYWVNNPGSFERMPWFLPYLGLEAHATPQQAAAWIVDAIQRRTQDACYGFPLPQLLAAHAHVPGVSAIFHLVNRSTGHTLLNPLPGALPAPPTMHSKTLSPFKGATPGVTPGASPLKASLSSASASPARSPAAPEAPAQIAQKLSDIRQHVQLLKQRAAAKAAALSVEPDPKRREGMVVELKELERMLEGVRSQQADLQASYEGHFPALFQPRQSQSPQETQRIAGGSPPVKQERAGNAGLSLSREHNGLQVVKIEGGAAKAGGFNLGDVLVAIGGTPLEGKTAEEAEAMLSGPAGTSVTVMVKESRRGSQPKSVHIQRL